MGHGADPEIAELKADIDQSREQLGDAVAALAYKADVKNRGRELIEDKKEAIMEKVHDVKDSLPGGEGAEGGIAETVKSKLPSGEGAKEKLDALKDKLPDTSQAREKIRDAAPSTEAVKEKASGAAGVVREHPGAVVAGATAAGFAAGMALPETEIERQKVAPAARDAREQVQATAQQAVERAKDAAREAADAARQAAGSAADTVKEKGQAQGGKLGEMAEKAADKTKERVDSGPPPPAV